MDRKEKIKKNILNISKIVIFLTICAVLLHSLSPIFVPKSNTDIAGIKYENARGFYGEEHQSLDVLAVGNSDLYSAMNPLQLWKNQGITSYVSAEPYQSIFGAYYMLDEVLACQKPKVIVLEVDELFSKSEEQDIDEAINSALKNCFPLFEYHSRWKNLTVDDFNDKGTYYNQRMQSKGYLFHDNINPHREGFSYMKNSKKRSELTFTTKTYLDKFIKLANRNGADVVFVWFPTATTGTQKRHDTIQALANQYDVPFIDFNTNQYDTGFDWLTDSRDGGNHLNYNGATKVTKYLGEYLKNNYQLTDHRDDEKYDQWNKDYENFMKKNKLEY